MLRSRRRRAQTAPEPAELAPISVAEAPPFDIASNDPILAYLASVPGTVDLDAPHMESAGLRSMREAGVKLVVPLVTHGELIGLLTLGPRLSEQEYSTDDRKLLENLAAHAAPAVRVAQLVKQQEDEARERERYEQELRVATLIQEHLLPKEAPDPDGYRLAAYYKPARHVGGDFYDFIDLPDGRVGLVIGDVTDKGVPAALVMASTRSLLRAAAERLVAPGEVLQRVNEQAVPSMPPNMFVTCFYAVLDPATGRIEYANAGHNLPYVRTASGSAELRATGMPLGLLPGVTYEQKEAVIAPGETLLLHSDGIAEAHDPSGEMFGFPRMASLVGSHRGDLIDALLTELGRFTGDAWEQEDDVTLVALERNPGRELDVFDVSSEPGNERGSMERVASVAAALGIAGERLERVKTAVAETTMNAMEHGNGYDPSLRVHVRVVDAAGSLLVSVRDHGSFDGAAGEEVPDIDAKLAGEQSPRGWGLFLVRNMVDHMRVTNDGEHHAVELIWRLGGGDG